MNRYLILTIFTAVVLVTVGCGSDDVAEYVEPLTNVEYYTVIPRPFERDITLPVVVTPFQEVNLGLASGGKVTAIHVDKGSSVERGDVMLETDDVMLRAQLDVARANLEFQQSEYARSEKLYEGGSITAAQYDGARLALAQANAALVQAEKALDDATLEAPFDGTITMRNAEIGDILSPGAPAFRLINMQSVKVQAGIPEKYISDFEVGSSVTLTIDAIPGRTFNARINYLSPEASPEVRTFLAEMVIENRDGMLRSGVMGNAHIMRKTVDNAKLIPINAVIQTADGPVVFVLRDGNTVERREVTLMSSDDLYVQVENVAANERIIARGQYELIDGETVNVTGEYRRLTAEETQE